MKLKAFYLLSLIVATLFLAGCAAKNLNALEEAAPNEAIVVAKIRVIYNGEDVTKMSSVSFPGNPSAVSVMDRVVLDETGYVFIKRPAGEDSIRVVTHRAGIISHDFDPKELTCQLSANEITYIGDITFEWTGSSAGTAWTISLLSNNILKLCGDITVSVESNFDAAREAFREKFHTDRDMKISLLAVGLAADKHKK